jgi:hypothetical protein
MVALLALHLIRLKKFCQAGDRTQLQENQRHMVDRAVRPGNKGKPARRASRGCMPDDLD